MDSEEQAISRAATIQMRAAADLTVRSPREYCLCLQLAGITPGFRANGGNCLTSRLNWQRRQVVESEVAGSSAFWLGAFVHALRAVCGADVAEPAFLIWDRLHGVQATLTCHFLDQWLSKSLTRSQDGRTWCQTRIRRMEWSDTRLPAVGGEHPSGSRPQQRRTGRGWLQIVPIFGPWRMCGKRAFLVPALRGNRFLADVAGCLSGRRCLVVHPSPG